MTDLISRDAALAVLNWGDIYGRNAQDAIRAIPAVQVGVNPLHHGADDQERNYLHLHNASYDVWKWFETSRPDLIGPRASKLRDAVMGPRPYGHVDVHQLSTAPVAASPQPDPVVNDPRVVALVEALTLASNRLAWASIQFDTGTQNFITVGEWAHEALRAIGGEA